MRRIINIFLLVLMVLILSCQKQSAPSFESDRIESSDELRRNKYCEKVSFLKDFLNHDNTKNLFNCLSWDKEFPYLYNSIAKISSADWNHLFKPIDENFFANRDRRDRVLGYFKGLNEIGVLDDLSNVINSLNDTNFFDEVNSLLSCSISPDSSICEDRKNRVVTKQEIFKLFEFLKYDPETINKFLYLANGIINSLANHENEFRTGALKLLGNDLFSLARVSTVTALSRNIVKNGISLKDTQILADVLNSNSQRGENFLFEWLHSNQLKTEDFYHLLTFPISRSEQIVRNFKALNYLRENPKKCQGVEGLVATIDIGPVVNDMMGWLEELSYQKFMEKLVEAQTLMVATKALCPDVNNFDTDIYVYEFHKDDLIEKLVNYPLDLRSGIDDLAAFVKSAHLFDIAKYVAAISKKHEGSTYLIELLSGSVLEVVLKTLKIVQTDADILFDITLPFLKGIDKRSYVISSDLTQLLYLHQEQYKVFAKSWDFFSHDQRNFLFNYIDSHIKNNANFIELFKFYMKMASEITYLSTPFYESYALDESVKDKSFHALANTIKQFSGEDVLNDFRRFFSSDHIMKIITILARGVNISIPSIASLKGEDIDRYYQGLSVNSYSIDWSIPQRLDGQRNCIHALTEVNGGLVELVKKLPDSCNLLSADVFILSALSGIFEFGKSYSEQYPILDNRELFLESEQSAKHTIFDVDGLISSPILLSSVSNMKKIDNAGRVNNHGGLENILNVIKKYIIDFFEDQIHVPSACTENCGNLVSTLEDATKLISSYLSDESKKFTTLRNSVLKEYLSKDTSFAFDFLKETSSLLNSYGNWWINDTGYKVQPHDPSYDCKNVLRADIGAPPCPDLRTLQDSFLRVSDLFTRENDDDQPTGLELFVKAMSPSVGLKIPYDSKKQTLYHMSLAETMKMMYETMDKTYERNGNKINKLEMPFTEQGKNESKKMVTTAQRIEVVVRDIRFDNNYLGAHFMNSVARSNDYVFTVKNKHTLLKRCALGLKFCGKFFSKEEKRLVRNAINAYPSLWHIEEFFDYSKYMQTLLQVVVGSSSKISSKAYMVKVGNHELPFLQTKKQLEKHNGKILTELSMLSLFSNGGRVLHDRFGRGDKNVFYEFLNDVQTKRMSSRLFQFMNPSETIRILRSILHSNKVIKDENGKHLSDHVIDFVYNLNYDEQQLLENTVKNILLLSSFIGPADKVFENSPLSRNLQKYQERFQRNSISGILNLTEKLFSTWRDIGKSANRRDFIDILGNLNTLTRFLNSKLLSKSQDQESAYIILNELVYLLDNYITPNKVIEDQEIAMFDIIRKMLSSDNLRTSLFSLMRDAGTKLDKLHLNGADKSKEFFTEISSTAKLLLHDDLDYGPLKNYLVYTTREYVCKNDTNFSCWKNYHYDEPFKILSTLSKSSSAGGKTNIRNLLEFILERRHNDMIELLDLVVKSVKINKL